MTGTPRTFLVAIELTGSGAHPGAQVDSAAAADPRRQIAAVRSADRLGFDAAFLGEPARVAAKPDPVLLAAYAAPLTGAIGLIARSNAIAVEPFHAATQITSLDHASAGRAGWWVDVVDDPAVRSAYAGHTAKSPEEWPREAADVIEVARRLWDSWEDDAVIRDVASGRYLDRDRIHYADFVGRWFRVKGPAITPRPPQGQPLVFSAVGAIGPEQVDVRIVHGATVDDVRHEVSSARARGYARVVVDVEIALDHAGLRAVNRVAALDGVSPWDPSGALRVVGDPRTAAALVGEIAQVADGVRLVPAETGVDLEEAGRAILPLLRRGGLSSPVAVGGTLREAFGLPRPPSRYASAS